jgi:hypothetical protein
MGLSRVILERSRIFGILLLPTTARLSIVSPLSLFLTFCLELYVRVFTVTYAKYAVNL